jgi:hypothetical protein
MVSASVASAAALAPVNTRYDIASPDGFTAGVALGDVTARRGALQWRGHAFCPALAQACSVRDQIQERAMDDLIRTFAARGDLAHVALFLWASSASALGLLALREWSAASRRFSEFVNELARFNDRFKGRK